MNYRTALGSTALHLAASAAAILAALSFFFAASAHAQLAAPHSDYVVVEPVLDVLSAPSVDSDIASQILYGSGVAALEQKDGWIHIHTADDYSGWVRSSALRPLVAGTSYPAEGKLVRVAALSANIYREPDVTLHLPLLRLPWESPLEAIPEAQGNNARWLSIRLADGRIGWIQRGDITDRPTAISLDEMVALARRFLGITYTWGGTSSFGFDCSGFTQMLERQRGIIMPRDADSQANWSGVAPVERKDITPGDLLYFGSSPQKITHTGMYIGNGEFIHDTVHDHPGVQISKLSDEYWTHLLVAIRRVK